MNKRIKKKILKRHANENLNNFLNLLYRKNVLLCGYGKTNIFSKIHENHLNFIRQKMSKTELKNLGEKYSKDFENIYKIK